MPLEAATALALYAFAASITPGPNNLMLMASGANFGLARTLPHLFGVCLGFVAMLVLVGAGIAQVFATHPVALTVLKALAAAAMLVIAYKIATAAPTAERKAGRPLRFVEAALFQWVNPKAWAMALGAMTLYVPDPSLGAILWAAAVFALVNAPCISLWTLSGQALGRLLHSPRRLRLFNSAMALLLVGSLVTILA